MSQPLPIGVLIPTRNAASLWKKHLSELRQIIAVAEEVVVVDSESTDGTVELLRSELSHPRIRFLPHPPGLYASWNFGLSQIAARYSYIATAGDTIVAEDLRCLFSHAEKLEVDVMLSVPRFFTDAGREQPGKRWPIHDVIDGLNIAAPVALSRSEGFIASLPMEALGGLMGSSASNLYRTAVLQERPFHTGFGHVGDTAWGVANALAVRFGVTPQRCASFVVHPKVKPLTTADEHAIEDSLFAIAREALHTALGTGSLPPDARKLEAIVQRFTELRRDLRPAKLAYDTGRKGNPLWFLRPSVVSARNERNRIRTELRRLWSESLHGIRF